MKYYTTKQKPLSVSNNIVPGDSISKVQSSLCPSLRHIVTYGVGYGVGFSTSEPEESINNFDKRDFTTLFKEHQNLSKWYKENKEALEKLKVGDFSDYTKVEDTIDKPKEDET